MKSHIRILLLSADPESIRLQWARSGCAEIYEDPWYLGSCSVERILAQVRHRGINVLVLDHDLKFMALTGAKVVELLRRVGYRGQIVANCATADPFLEHGVTVNAVVGADPASGLARAIASVEAAFTES